MAWKTHSEQYFPTWDSYSGTYEKTVWKFWSDSLMPSGTVANLAKGFISTFKSHGHTLMYMKVEVSTDLILTTDYRITTYSPAAATTAHQIGLNVGWVQFLVVAIIAMAAIIVVIYASHVISEVIKTIGPVLPDLINMGYLAIGATVALVSLWLIFGGKEKRYERRE
jgi:hypothetical protein